MLISDWAGRRRLRKRELQTCVCNAPHAIRMPRHGGDRAEALSLLRRGADRLKAMPEADRASFVPRATDQEREERCARRQQAELRSRAAIREGKTAYDE